MLYLGIDQHKRQLTVNLRCEDGSVTLKRQVSTQWERVRAFFDDLAEKARPEGGFLAILEVCGMNPWLVTMLQDHACREIVVIQPTERAKQKTDRRDAGHLSHLSWIQESPRMGIGARGLAGVECRKSNGEGSTKVPDILGCAHFDIADCTVSNSTPRTSWAMAASVGRSAWRCRVR